MSSRTSPQTGLLVAGAGGAAVLGSLWLPWYTIRLPEAFRNAVSKLGDAAGSTGSAATPQDQMGSALGSFMKGLVAAMPSEITGDGWQVMNGGDVALAILGGIALLAVLAMTGGTNTVIRTDPGAAGRLIALVGLVCTAIALYHVVRHPGAGVSGGFATGLEDAVSVRYGAYLASLGGVLMIAGGLLAGRPGSAPETMIVETHTPEAPVYTPPAPYTPPTPYTQAPAAPDPFGETPAPAPAASAPAPMPSPPPSAPGGSIAPPGWAPPA